MSSSKIAVIITVSPSSAYKRLNVIAERLEKQEDISSENISDYSENVEKLQNLLTAIDDNVLKSRKKRKIEE